MSDARYYAYDPRAENCPLEKKWLYSFEDIRLAARRGFFAGCAFTIILFLLWKWMT